jgi:hypothetical protein
MLFAAMEAPATRTRVFLFALLAATLSSCSSNSDNPVTPPSGDDDAPAVMVTIVGSPRVKVFFTGNITESEAGKDPRGMFWVVVTDSIGRRTFLEDVRLQGVPMHEEFDPVLGQPARYTLDVSEMPGLQVGDTLHFDVIDGGDLTPPFSYAILPSHMLLPADSTVLHQSRDLVLPWTGAVERVLVTITDLQSKSIRFNYQVSNYSGGTRLTIPARDFAGLSPGPLFVSANVRDTELLGATGQTRQEFDLETHQSRFWQLAP